jgi:hypothetical protein
MIVGSMAAGEETTLPLAEPWVSAYQGNDATGKQVVALWHFTPGEEARDASGHGHELKLSGVRAVAEGRFGGCLETLPAEGGCGTVRHAAVARPAADLSPKGPFTLELWIKPKAEPAGYGESFLLDKKYVADDDYQLILGAADPSGRRVLRANLGFGGDSATWHASGYRFEPGRWYHLAFVYDGQGTGAFYINGEPQGGATIAGRKQISHGNHPLAIGDRIGSCYHGFPGWIDEVRISSAALEYRRVKLERVSDRSVFRRMEPGVVLRLAVSNVQREPLAGARLTIAVAGLPAREIEVPRLAAGASAVVEYPLDTSLRADAYRATARLSIAGPKPYEGRDSLEFRIVPRGVPQQFPVLMWGVAGRIVDELPRLKRMGFTHALGLGADCAKIFLAGKPTAADRPDRVAEVKQMLDEALANDLSIVASLSPGAELRADERFQRVDRQGRHNAKHPDICGLLPELRPYCYNVGASVAQTYRDFPAFVGALIHTEVRDAATPCFHAEDREAYRKATGAEIPPQAASPRGVSYQRLAGFPASRVVADDDPLYVYYRWYWKQGDGWNGLTSAVSRGLKEQGRPGLWTFHDPAARVAKVYGSGGAVDVISQWTYSYPDPIRIAVATDELLAMAAGAAAPQQVMKMTQIIWYRSQTAPAAKAGEPPPAYQAAWEQEQPGAQFITIAPMHLREALWTKIARPIKGIMYHGYQSLVSVPTPASYCFTNPETQDELARLTAEVIRPLGPTLLSVPGVKSDVAFLESFAAEMFAGRGTYGWCGGWQADAYHVMLYAHLQPEIVYDETISQRGLEGFRVLVAADCDVITESMRGRIKAFQAGGGLVIGDDHTAPGIRPDIVLPSYKRSGDAAADKAALLRLAAMLRKELEGRYTRRVDSNRPEVIPYLRRYRDTDYVFVVNDRREYGQYVGQHGVVMENGLPAEAVLGIARRGGHVYDLVGSRPMEAREKRPWLLTDVQLGPCDGRLYMVTERPIEQVRVAGPSEVARGQSAALALTVTDATGHAVEAVVPMEVTIRDAEGRRCEFSGYYAAVDGTLSIRLDVATNDVPGIWQIDARELASGRTATHYLRVLGAKEWPPGHKRVPQELANPVQPKG